MAYGKRRKGKHSGRSTPVGIGTETAAASASASASNEEEQPPPSTDSPVAPNRDTETVDDKSEQKSTQDAEAATESKGDAPSDPTTPPDGETDNKNTDTAEAPAATATATTTASSTEAAEEPRPPPKYHSSSSHDTGYNDTNDLVLTSEKKRGVYECDYCHSDISQLPRIRCAVCTDFDLCLDCFATTDHAAAIARLKAAATTHSELQADGITSTMVLSSAAANHDDTHGYRVCDSTRYPVFGSNRHVLVADTLGGTNKDGTNTMEEDDDDQVPSHNDMELDGEDSKSTASERIFIVSDDPKTTWTAEEDLRLLDAIKAHGLGNWVDISEAVGGNGSIGKTPKRCMERYFDDFLGRYGHILPKYIMVDDDSTIPSSNTVSVTNEGMNEDSASINNNNNIDDTESPANTGEDKTDNLASPTPSSIAGNEEESIRSSKRRVSSLSRLPSNISTTSLPGGRTRKRYKVVPTETLPGYNQVWPTGYLPPGKNIETGQEVARDLSTKNEVAFFKAIIAAPTKEEADKIRQDWIDTRMHQIGAPTVLPPRPEDSDTLPGADLVGFMPRRGDFDLEWENDAENALADMEFTRQDTEQDRQLKMQVLQIYYQKQNEREKRKKFILSRKLYDYRKYTKDEEDLPQDERDLMHRMRLFERFHTPDEHKRFIADILKAKRLRKEIAKLQMYRRIGIRSLAEAEKYELDKCRRQFHKVSQLQKEVDAGAAKPASAMNVATSTTETDIKDTTNTPGSDASESLWKQYRTSDRTSRRSVNRFDSSQFEPESLGQRFDGVRGPERQLDTQGSKEKEEDEKAQIAGKNQSEARKDPKMGDVAADAKPKGDDEEGASASKENNTSYDGEEITRTQGYDLLSTKEVSLCSQLKLKPLQYLEIKKALIYESLTKGLLEKGGSGSGRRMVIKVDIERRENIIDFMLQSGWISTKLASAARALGPTRGAE